ncbi:unnamed protein product [Diatraea saccharalis]|uniref:Uncharacterized protein n=1 Tax=Diatraea saccharalis TaxID=40085 RepID=A0A9N9QZK9_9NEOP|nr:unnamed protein product [Diatraea saccharalis]
MLPGYAFQNLYDIENIAKWLSCNGEVWGMGPTAVFASAAALFLYNELEATVFVPGDHAHVSVLEKTLISPNMLLEMTTAGLLGGPEMMPLGTLTRFLRQQQPQIHITVCWFLSLCYADYVRKNYCTRFNMPYLEQWQTELHERAARGVRRTMEKVNSFVGNVHQRLRGYAPPAHHRTPDTHTIIVALGHILLTRVRARCRRDRRRWRSAGPTVPWSSASGHPAMRPQAKSFAYDSSTVQWAKCGESAVSTVPTALWAVGAAALSHRLLGALFRRFLFRRVPLWELILQIDMMPQTDEETEGKKLMQQWIVWMCGLVPLVVYLQTRPRPETPSLMIWITPSPWQRREMGPYGYYLNRPLTSLQSTMHVTNHRQALALRKAFSDTKIAMKEPPKKRRYSKSV